MIEYQLANDWNEVLELCLRTHPQKEHSFLHYYFHNLYDLGMGLLIRENDAVVSCMRTHEHTLLFREQVLLCSYIFGVSTNVDYRERGFMDQLMHSMLDYSSKNYLISFIEAYNPKIYKKYGFETIAYRKRINIYQEDIKVQNVNGISTKISALELVELYQEFAKRFDCLYHRDSEYFTHYIQQAVDSGGTIITYRNRKGQLRGYCVYYDKEEFVEVKEAIYMDALALHKLLKYAIQTYKFLNLEVSNHEQIDKIFKNTIPRTYTSVMARINNYPLFNKLYDTGAKTVEEAFRILKKPVWINEKY